MTERRSVVDEPIGRVTAIKVFDDGRPAQAIIEEKKDEPPFLRVNDWEEFEHVVDKLYDNVNNSEALDYLTVMMIGGLAGYIQREIERDGMPKAGGEE